MKQKIYTFSCRCYKHIFPKCDVDKHIFPKYPYTPAAHLVIIKYTVWYNF